MIYKTSSVIIYLFGGVRLKFDPSFLLTTLISMCYLFAVLLVAFPVHELSHAFVAYKLGDPTAKMAGRLTLNPFKHLDLVGTICLIFLKFGWAKPVPVDPRYFKNPKSGMAIVSLAGPLSNLILAFISLIAYQLIDYYGNNDLITNIIFTYFYYAAIINIGLCIFNLIPLPPLDGEKILAFFLPDTIGAFFQRYSMIFQIVLIVLIISPILQNPLNILVSNLFNNLNSIVSFILSPLLKL